MVCMYLKAFEHSLDIPDFYKTINNVLLVLSAPLFFMKNVMNFIQLLSAASKIVEKESIKKGLVSNPDLVHTSYDDAMKSAK